jgi:CheY-like chemotaxis protein
MEEVRKDQKVVIIDDDFAVRQIFGLLLKHFTSKIGTQIEVYSSSNGLEGMGYLMVTLPDIIILDTTLPKYSGTEIADFLVSNPRYKDQNLKVLLVEGSDYLSEGFLKFNKKDKGFIQLFIEETIGKDALLDLSRTDRLILRLSSKNIRIIDFADRQIKSKDNIRSPINKLYRSLLWGIAQICSSVLLVFLYGFLGRWEDENITQSHEDLKKYRVRYYPTVATLIISFFVLMLQFSLFTVGGITIINSRVVDAVADESGYRSIDLEDSVYSNQVSYENGQFSFNDDLSIATIVFQDGVESSKILRFYEESNFNSIDSSDSTIITGYTVDQLPVSGITYQISSDLEVWYFYNGFSWVSTTNGADDSNTVQEINMFINSFDNSENILYVKAYLHSNGENVLLKSLSFEIENNFIQKLID